jgi:ectoine hydroxylase-related dioxygenase (phytanoyl-CoA dioxygenase family)
MAELETRGWTVTEPLLGPDECDFLVSVLRGRDERPRSLAGGRPMTLQTMLSMSDPILGGYIADERLASVAVDVLGPDVKIFWEQVVTRKPGCTGALPWHQDAGYSTTMSDDILSFWLALTDATPGNGGLVMADASHRDGVLRHEEVQVAPGSMLRQVVAADMPDESSWTQVSVGKGQAVVFTPTTVHASFANTSGSERRGWIIHYAHAHAVHAATGRPLDNRPWVAQGGEFPGELIFDQEWSMTAPAAAGPAAKGWVPLDAAGELDRQGAGVAPSR